MDHLRHMAIFKLIVDCGSISAAADKLSLSKSVVSHHLKSLELAVLKPVSRLRLMLRFLVL